MYVMSGGLAGLTLSGMMGQYGRCVLVSQVATWFYQTIPSHSGSTFSWRNINSFNNKRACATRCMDIVEVKGVCKDEEVWRKLVRMEKVRSLKKKLNAQFLVFPIREHCCLNNREQQLSELEKLRKQSDHLEATQHICQ
uniref:(California timema) hypothetical protein n=1 Tax=Timema californicum TaxID=61474 RepID=A0A7R9PB72_TIMCA|nr:unnamed protein product [Timema californicum]